MNELVGRVSDAWLDSDGVTIGVVDLDSDVTDIETVNDMVPEKAPDAVRLSLTERRRRYAP